MYERISFRCFLFYRVVISYKAIEKPGLISLMQRKIHHCTYVLSFSFSRFLHVSVLLIRLLSFIFAHWSTPQRRLNIVKQQKKRKPNKRESKNVYLFFCCNKSPHIHIFCSFIYFSIVSCLVGVVCPCLSACVDLFFSLHLVVRCSSCCCRLRCPPRRFFLIKI